MSSTEEFESEPSYIVNDELKFISNCIYDWMPVEDKQQFTDINVL